MKTIVMSIADELRAPTGHHMARAHEWLAMHLPPAMLTPGMRRDLARLLAQEAAEMQERFQATIRHISMGLPDDLMLCIDTEGAYSVEKRAEPC